MPKITFFNLAAEKRERLMQALHAEFSRVPLNEASIANIVKAAGIPRGSFYQYFENKDDAFLFMLEQVVVGAQASFHKQLQAQNGDLFAALGAFYRIFLEDAAELAFLRNTFLHMSMQKEQVVQRIFKDTEQTERFDEIRAYLNTAFQHLSATELYYLMDILMVVTFHNIVRKFANDLPVEAAAHHYEQELAFLQKRLLQDVPN